MLKAMRKHVKYLAPMLWLVIATFIIAIFAVWGGGQRFGQAREESTLATVGRKKISAEFYGQNLKERLESLRKEFKELDKNLIQQLNVPQQVLEQMIQQALLLQVAEEMGIDASEEEIRGRIKSTFQRDGKFIGFQEYKSILAWNHISISDFETSLRREIIINKVINTLTAGVAVSPDEVWENYKNQNETAKIEFVTLEVEKVKLDTEPLLVEIQEYFEKNKEEYKIPEKREGAMVFLETEDLKKEIALTVSEVEKYYKNNLSQFQEPEQLRVSRIYLAHENKEKESVMTEAGQILEKIKSGEDFGELARRYSKDNKAEQNGDWGFYDWKTLSTEEQREIDSLSEGEASGILELEAGVSILKVTEKKPATTKPLEEVKDRVRSILEDTKARELAEERVKNLGKTARKEKNFELAAQKQNLQTKSTGLLQQGAGVEGIDPSGLISDSLFKLKVNDISSPVYTYNGVGLAQLKKIEPPRPATFDEVQTEVKEELIAQRKKDLALEKMNNIRAELGTKSLEALAEKYGVEYKTADEHRRGQYLSVLGESAKADELAFSLPRGTSSEPIEFKGGYALIRVLDRKELTLQDLEKDKETENLLETKKNKFLQSMMLKLQEEHEVRIRPDIFQKIYADVLSRFAGE